MESVRDIAGSYVDDIIVGTDQPMTSIEPTEILDSQIQTQKVQPDFTGRILTEIPSEQSQQVSTPSSPENLQESETVQVTQTVPTTTTPFKFRITKELLDCVY